MVQNKKTTKITFIIGNGFDIGLDLKTRYVDVYNGYVKTPSNSENIKKFKEELSNDVTHNYEKWSDFEMGIAEYAKKLTSEDELVECIRDFKGYMVKHLKTENEKIFELIKSDAHPGTLIKELDRSLEKFYEGLIPNDIHQLKNLIDDHTIERNYITFNYTSTLELFLALKEKYYFISESAPIHIHGNLNRDVVMGVDNLEQLNGVSFSLTKKGMRAVVKTFFNEEYDKTRTNLAINVIEQSDIICVYGFSMGKSDKIWVDLILKWLKDYENNHLVIYRHDNATYNYYNYDEIMDIEDDKKVKLLNELGIKDDKILNQIHIPIGRKIFDFRFEKANAIYQNS